MQSGGQAAGIQLQVGLDLAFFRNQLPKLGAAAAGYTLPINIKFDRRAVQNELNALGRNISQRTYRLEVATNLAAEIELAKKLTTALNNLGRSQQTAKTGVGQRLGVGAIGRAPSQGGLGSKDVEKLYRASARAGLLAFDKEIARTKISMVAAMDAIGVDAIAGLLNGLSSQDARLRAAAESIGENLIKTTKTSLGIASPSKKFEEIGRNVGKGFEKGALSSMDNAFDAMENKMRQRGKILDTIARGIFGMLGMDPAAMMQQARQQKAVPPRTPIAGLLPEYTSRGAREEIMRQLGAGGGGGGGPSDQGPGKLALSNEALGKRVSAILEEYFRVAEVQVRESFDPRELKRSLNIFAYIAQSLRDAEARTRQARVEQKVDAFIKALELTMQTAEARLRIQAAQVRTVAAQQPLLPAGRVAGLLPGRPSQASVLELNNILAGAIREYFKAVAREIKPSATTQGRPLLGPGSTVAGLLPPAGGTTATGRMRITTGAVLGQPSMMRAPSVPPSVGGGGAPPVPPSGGGGGGGGSFGGVRFNVPQLPGTGVVREIGSEFAMAAKQVLLFGTAYKALAFLTSFPAQVGQAVGALQSFNNTLKAISPTANEAKASNQFILDIVDRYNVPLQSARDGFTKLYASMAPAGFKGDEIRALFTGVSQAAATFGMSADKVDRVNYAFAQMASKGQVMSEELKGQLGDVLPGAMGIFAEAAGFTGPDAIQKFSKALEDGAYKGEAMRGLLKNVTVVLTKEFGPGAEGAARTFQGVINRMQNSTRLLYEAFEPVAVGFLNSVVVPLTSGIKTITDGFNAFFTSTQAKTAGGMAFAQELERLKPAFEGIRTNVAALMPVLQGFGKTLLEIGKVALQIAGNPLVGYLGRLYLIILPINMALGVLRGLWASNALQLVIFNARVANGTSTLTAFRGMMAATGATATITAGRIRAFSIALQAAFSATAIGLVVVGLGMIAEAFMTAGARADAARQKMSQFADSVKQLGAIGDVAGATAEKVGQQALASRLQNAKTLLQQVKAEGKKLTKSQVDELKALQLTGNLEFIEVGRGAEKGLFGATKKITNLLGTQAALQAEIDSAERGRLETQTRIVQATRAVTEAKKNQGKEEAKLQKIDLSGGDGTGKKPKEQSLESYYSLQDQLAKNFTQAEIDRLEAEHQRKVDLIKAEYDLKETRANSFQREALKFERRMAEIGLEREGALLKASNDVLAAQGSVAGGAGGGGARGGGKGLGAGIAQYITGDPSSPFYRADHGGGNYHEHLAFVSRQAAEEAYKKLTSAGIQVTEFKGKSRVGRHTPGSAHYEGLAFDVPGAQVPVGRERELTARVQSTLGIGGARPAPVPASRKRDIIADQKVQIEQAKQSATARQAEAKAIKDAEIALADFVATATPVEEQKLQNDLLKRKTELMMQGYSDSAVDQAIKFAEAEYKVNFALKLNDELQKKGKRTKAEADAITKQMTEGLTAYSLALKENSIQLRDNQLAQAMTVLKDRMAMAGAITPDQELREQIRQKNPDFTPEQQEGLFQQEKLAQGAEKLKADMQGIASSIGDSFGQAFKGIITGSMTAQEALAGMFQSIADHFADMVAKMIAEWLKTQILQGFQSIFSAFTGGLGGGISSGLSSGFSAGDASAIPTDAAGWGASFGTSLQFANGGIAPGGFTAFANGGMVTGPTMGLVGEGRYNEAIVPLPDGKSIPVDLGGAMGGQAANNIVVNVDAKGSKVEGNEQDSKQLGRVIAAAIQQELVKQKRPGGLLG